jgi:peptide/nickel transport system ATP-binding protein
MFQGKVVEQGGKEEIFTAPYPAYTALLLSSVPEMDPDWLTQLQQQRTEAEA